MGILYIRHLSSFPGVTLTLSRIAAAEAGKLAGRNIFATWHLLCTDRQQSVYARLPEYSEAALSLLALNTKAENDERQFLSTHPRCYRLMGIAHGSKGLVDHVLRHAIRDLTFQLTNETLYPCLPPFSRETSPFLVFPTRTRLRYLSVESFALHAELPDSRRSVDEPDSRC